jgi:hypothetical protein
MAVTLMTAAVVGAVQAAVIPAILSLTKQEYALLEIVLFSIISGALYLVPTVGATISFLSMIGLLYWRLRPDNIFIDVLIPVGVARLLCVPALMLIH